MPSAQQNIREAILSSKGLRIGKINGVRSVTNQALLPEDSTGRKTNLMKYVEAHHKTSIEDLVWSDSVEKLAVRLELSQRTISYWRKLFPRDNHVTPIAS